MPKAFLLELNSKKKRTNITTQDANKEEFFEKILGAGLLYESLCL